MDTPSDVYQCLAETIDARLNAPPGGVPGHHAGESASGTGDAEVLRLEADQKTVQLHSQLIGQPVTYGEASFCQECGEPAPCETIRRLAEQYECASPY